MKLKYLRILLFFVVLSCGQKQKISPALSTDAFDYTGNITVFAQNMGKKSALFSLGSEITLVNTDLFSITNRYVMPFLYYQIAADSLDLLQVSKEQIKELFYFMAYSLAQKELYYREAVDSGITIDETEANALIEAHIGNVEQYQAYLKDSPLQYSFIVSDLKKNIIIEKYRNEKLSSEQEISDQDVFQYYQTDPTISKINPSLQVRHVFVGLSPSFSKEKAFAKISQAKKEAEAGKEFADVVKKYSEEQESAKRGGFYSDFITRGSMKNEALERAVFHLNPGMISEIIETPTGYELLKVEEIHDEGTIVFEDMKENIKKLMRYEQKSNAIEAENRRIEQNHQLNFVTFH